MPYAIDDSTYDKAKKYPVDYGYNLRLASPTALIVHSTEGIIGQSFANAATYLYNSAKVSAHFLIGRSAEIVQFLDPQRYAAWHAGAAIPAYINPNSIGIECLHARSETWPAAQKDALAWLLNQLCDQFAIPADRVDTHGQVALPGPYIRKRDPTDWDRAAFVAWRDHVLKPPTWAARITGLPVYQRADRTGPLWGHLDPNQHVVIDDLQTGHIAELDGEPAAIGFVDIKGLEAA